MNIDCARIGDGSVVIYCKLYSTLGIVCITNVKHCNKEIWLRGWLFCRRILTAGSADEFYSLMGVLTQETMEGRIFNADLLIKVRIECIL